MSIRVRRDDLLAALRAVEPGVAERETVDQSTCFAFKSGYVFAYNEEIAARAKSPLGKKITGAVRAGSLLKILQKLPDDELLVSCTEKELILSGKRRKTGLLLEQEVRLDLSVVEVPEESAWKPLPADFEQAVQTVASCSSTQDQLMNLTCIHVCPKYLEACDNFQLVRYYLKMRTDHEFLVRGSSLKEVAVRGVSQYSETENWAHFRNLERGVILSCLLLVDENPYPDLAKFLDFEGSQVVLPSGLAEAVEKAEIFSSEEKDDNLVSVTLSNGRLRLRGTGVTGWYEESKPVKYEGEELSFLIRPQLLADLTKKSNECLMSDRLLKVDGGAYEYATVLSRPDVVTQEPVEAEVD